MATIDLSAYEPTPGQVSDATAISNAFVAIQNAVNALDNANIAAGANIAVSKLALPGGTTNFLREDGTWQVPGGSGTGVPSGVVSEFAGASVPAGWLLCDGSAVSRTTYAALFTAIGTAFGAGNGSTTFNVPDLQGRVPVGKSGVGGHADVTALASNDGATLANRRPKHRHDVYDPGHTHSYKLVNTNSATAGVDRDANIEGTATHTTVSATTGIKVNPGGVSADTTSPLNTPAYLVVNYIIKQ